MRYLLGVSPAVADANQELRKGGLHGEDRSKGEVCPNRETCRTHDICGEAWKPEGTFSFVSLCLSRSTRRASRRGGSLWTTGGSCTTKIHWYLKLPLLHTVTVTFYFLDTPKTQNMHQYSARLVCGEKHNKTDKIMWYVFVFFFILCLNQLHCLSLCSQDAYARGEVFVGSQENGYSLLPELPANTQGSHWPFGITIVTPERNFLFTCETEENQKDWLVEFQTVIDRPMLPQEYAGKMMNQLR